MISTPDFGPLSKPYASAVKAFRQSLERLALITDPAITHGLTDAGQADRFRESLRR